jgi:hypothetical protein
MERGLWAGPQGERDCLHKEARARAQRKASGLKKGLTESIVFMFTVYCLQII